MLVRLLRYHFEEERLRTGSAPHYTQDLSIACSRLKSLFLL
jgi:hypothetical protein